MEEGGCESDVRRDLDLLAKLAGEGCSIIPLEPATKRPYRGFWLTPWLGKAASVEQVRAWMLQYPGCDWGLVLGAASGGIITVDIDSDEGRKWCRARGGFGRTPWYTTGRGEQLLYRVPAELSMLGIVRPYLGVEVRMDRHYSVIPPSTHPKGTRYRWIVLPDPDGEQLIRQQSAGHPSDGRAVSSIWPVPEAPAWVLLLLQASKVSS